MDIPIELFVPFTVFTFIIAIIGIFLGLKRVAGSPFIIMFAGILMFSQLAIVEDVDFNDRIHNVTSITDSLIVEERDYLYRIDTFTLSAQDLRQGTEARAQVFNSPATAIGKSFECMELYVAKSGSPSVSQLVQFGVFDSGSSITHSFGTLNVTDITLNFILYEFCLPDGEYHTIALGERVGARWNASADGNEILLRVDDLSNDVYESTQSRRQTWTTTWSSANGEMTMRLYNQTSVLLGATETYNYTPRSYSFNQNDTYLFYILFGVLFILIGLMVQFAKW